MSGLFTVFNKDRPGDRHVLVETAKGAKPMKISPWWIGLPAAMVATGTAWAMFWPKLGWETPNQHDADKKEMREAIATVAAAANSLEQNLANDIKGLSDLVQCERLEDRLRERLREREERELRDERETVDQAREIERLRERIGRDGLNCSQFG